MAKRNKTPVTDYQAGMTGLTANRIIRKQEKDKALIDGALDPKAAAPVAAPSRPKDMTGNATKDYEFQKALEMVKKRKTANRSSY